MPQPAPTAKHAVQLYEQKVTFERGKPLQFAAFALQFEGQTHVKVKDYPQGFVYENFTVTANGVTRKIVWSLGTGEIAPTEFSVAGQSYLLELKSSDFLGQLAHNELVVWREQEWEQKQKAAPPTSR